MDVPRSLDAIRAALLATQRPEPHIPGYPAPRPDVLRGGRDPIRLNPPTTAKPEWDATRTRQVTVERPDEPYPGDWVTAGVAYGAGAGAIPYRVTPEALAAYLDTAYRVGAPYVVGVDESGLARLGREASRVTDFRPNGATSRPRWAVVDWASSDDGVRAADPRDALITAVQDLDRMAALVGRLHSLGHSTPSDSRRGLWLREAEQLAAFRTELRESALHKLAALWAETVPELPPEPTTAPKRPAIRPARLR